MKNKDRERFFNDMSNLMCAGFNILDSLTLMDPVFMKDTEIIRKNLENGISFSESLKLLGCFEKADTEIIRLSEETGTLSEAMGDLGKMYKERREIKEKLISFTVYPVMMLIMLTAYMIFSMFFLVPMMKDLLDTLSVTGGMISRFDDIRKFIIEFRYHFSALSVILIIFSVMIFKKCDVGLKLAFGSKYRLYRENGFIDRLSKLMKGGCNILESLDMVGGDLIFSVEPLKAGLNEGNDICTCFSKGGFSKELCGILKINEESGNILKGFDLYLNTSQFILRSVMDRRMKLMEPISLILVGAVVGVTVVSVMGPLSEAFTRISV